MPSFPFTLKPFTPSESKIFSITGIISRDNGVLHVSYSLNGPLQSIRLPKPAADPERRDKLWEESCFEFFIATSGSEEYREVNISPSGNWNVYRFDSYRQGMQWEEKVTSIPCRIVSNSQTFTLEATLDVKFLGFMDKPLQVAISAVLLSKNNNLSYWALAHPGRKPEEWRQFHW